MMYDIYAYVYTERERERENGIKCEQSANLHVGYMGALDTILATFLYVWNYFKIKG